MTLDYNPAYAVYEFALPVEFDNEVKFGIGLPQIVLEYNTQYQKVISVNKSTDSVIFAGRTLPVTASYHD